MTFRAKIPPTPPPGKRIGQGGIVECEHPKIQGPLDVFRSKVGDLCPTCGWKETVDGGAFLQAIRDAITRKGE